MAVRLPSNIHRVGELSVRSIRPFPPSGFAAFEDHSLGNGDTFGLYWPFGKEDQEPLVVETIHDERALVPAFSTLDRFLELTIDLDEADHAEWPSVEGDEGSPYACYQAARAALENQAVAIAADLLNRATDRLPEYTAALGNLSALYLRIGNHAEACRVAVRAVRSPPSFSRGAQLEKIWSWLSRQTNCPQELADDPIWIRRAWLTTPPKGGTKENPTYVALAEAADVYAQQGSIVAALTLLQAYAEYMSRETVSFQERYGFSLASLRARQLALEAMLPAGSRAIATSTRE